MAERVAGGGGRRVSFAMNRRLATGLLAVLAALGFVGGAQLSGGHGLTPPPDSPLPLATVNGSAFATTASAPVVQPGADASQRHVDGKVAVLALATAALALAFWGTARQRSRTIPPEGPRAGVSIRGPPALQHA